jgi:hypothetical protein
VIKHSEKNENDAGGQADKTECFEVLMANEAYKIIDSL